MRDLIIMVCFLVALLAAVVRAEPDGGTVQHVHCWHRTDDKHDGVYGFRVTDDDVCCHCGMKKHCVGHGPFKPGCEQPLLRVYSGSTTLTVPGRLSPPEGMSW